MSILTRAAKKWGHYGVYFSEQKSGDKLANLFKNVKVQNWKNYNRTTVAVAETQEALMIMVFAMIGIITVFIVFVVFYMIVCHKSKDIGILKSVGASDAAAYVGLYGLCIFYRPFRLYPRKPGGLAFPRPYKPD